MRSFRALTNASAVLGVVLTFTSLSAQTTVYVDAGATGPVHDGTTWCTAYVTLQDALAVAAAETEIRVAAGSYAPDQGAGQVPGDIFTPFELIDGVALFGGYAGCGTPDPNERDLSAYETTLTGDLVGDDTGDVWDSSRSENSLRVVSAFDVGPTAILDGFIITGGHAFDQFSNKGGGMIVRYSSPVIRRCTFQANSAVFGGGMYNHASSPVVTNCTFRENATEEEGAGVFAVSSSDTVLINCLFEDNSAGYPPARTTQPGGGGSSSAGVLAGQDSRGLYVGGGAVYVESSGVTALNCLFAHNEAYAWGGAIYNALGSSSTVTNCTFFENTVTFLGGGINNYDSDLVINNSVFWGNSDQVGDGESAQIYVFGLYERVSLAYSCVQGLTGVFGGAGNIDGPPDFADADQRLAPESPCIDAADNLALPTDTYDLDGDGNTTEQLPVDHDGNARFINDGDTEDTGRGTPPLVDMGAYEFQAGGAECILDDDCNDGIPCTHNECVDLACVNTQLGNGTPCPDGVYCNGEEVCFEGVCVSTGPVDCSHLSDQCNAGVCNETSEACEIDSDPLDGEPCDDGDPLTGDDTCTDGVCVGGSCYAFRDLSDPIPAYVPGNVKTVLITLDLPPDAVAIGAEDSPPAPWVDISAISDGGWYDPENHKVKWGPFFFPFPTELTYDVLPPIDGAGQQCFSGMVSIDGPEKSICGDACISDFYCPPMAADEPQLECPGCGDCSCGACEDGRVELCEMIGYACAWKSGCNDDLGGMTRAAYVWKESECYCWDESQALWLPVSCPGPDPACCPTSALAETNVVEPSPASPSRAIPFEMRVLHGDFARESNRMAVRVPIAINPPSATSAVAWSCYVPKGWNVETIGNGGVWDEQHRKVKWGPYFDDSSRSASFTAFRVIGARASRAQTRVEGDPLVGFTGTISINGLNQPLTVIEDRSDPGKR